MSQPFLASRAIQRSAGGRRCYNRVAMTARPTSRVRSTHQIARAAVLVIAFFMISRVLGLTREIIIGARFGTTAEIDAYQAAFRVPDLLFQLIAGGALGSAFIPVFTGCLTRRDLTGAWRLFSGVTNLMLIVLTTLAAAMAIAAPWLVQHVLAPGFSARPTGAHRGTCAVDAHQHRDLWRQRRS